MHKVLYYAYELSDGRRSGQYRPKSYFYNDKLSMYSSFLVLELANIADFNANYIFCEFVSQELISSAIATGVLLNLTCKVNHNKVFIWHYILA